MEKEQKCKERQGREGEEGELKEYKLWKREEEKYIISNERKEKEERGISNYLMEKTKE